MLDGDAARVDGEIGQQNGDGRGPAELEGVAIQVDGHRAFGEIVTEFPTDSLRPTDDRP